MMTKYASGAGTKYSHENFKGTIPTTQPTTTIKRFNICMRLKGQSFLPLGGHDKISQVCMCIWDI